MKCNKERLASLGVALATRFCEENDIPIPRFSLLNRIGNLTGYYDSRGVSCVIFVPSCARHNVRYSWPGLFCDRTPYGVIQHELAHHVEQYYENLAQMVCRGGGYPITGYAPNVHEKFAEFFRLYLTNPDLLAKIRPIVFANLEGNFIKTTEESWEEVLRWFGAPEYVFQRVRNKIA